MTNAPILSQPDVRRDLQTYLSELLAADPRSIWQTARKSGMASGIDEVFHFFFDDNDFDERAVGVTLCDQSEVKLIANVKQALEALLDVVGDTGDDAYVSHPLWLGVRQAAGAAKTEITASGNGR